MSHGPYFNQFVGQTLGACREAARSYGFSQKPYAFRGFNKGACLFLLSNVTKFYCVYALKAITCNLQVQLKFLAEEMQAISKGLEKVVQELAASENDGPISENFCEVIFCICSFGPA